MSSVQPTRDPGCIFCKIIAGEIPSARVLETEHAMAFLDIHPVNPGHVLVLPKPHYPVLADLPDELAAHIGTLLPRLCRAVSEVTVADGLNVIVNNGGVAGQTIDHVHWHIIPRFQDDDVHWPWPHAVFAPDELDQLRIGLEQVLGPQR